MNAHICTLFLLMSLLPRCSRCSLSNFGEDRAGSRRGTATFLRGLPSAANSERMPCEWEKVVKRVMDEKQLLLLDCKIFGGGLAVILSPAYFIILAVVH